MDSNNVSLGEGNYWHFGLIDDANFFEHAPSFNTAENQALTGSGDDAILMLNLEQCTEFVQPDHHLMAVDPNNVDSVPAGPLSTSAFKSQGGPRVRTTRLNWDQHKDLIKHHYMTLDWSLTDTMKALEEKGFSAR